MGFSKSLISLMAVLLLLGFSMVEETRAQDDCASNLVPCANYLNSTKPPESCCKPLRETVQKQQACLCKLYSNPSLLNSLGINITQALELPKHCGVTADTSACSKVSSPAPTKSVTPPGGVPGRDVSGASKMAWTGVFSIGLLWASVMAY